MSSSEWFRLCDLPARAWVRWLILLLLCGMLVLPAAAQLRPRTRKPAPARPAVVAPLPENPPAVQKKLDLAADLVNQFKDSEALAIYQDVLKTNPLHYLALWQAAMLSVKIGARYSDETRKAAYFDAGRQYGDRALLLRPEGGESNLAVALALFNQATLYKAGARLKAFKDLRSHVYLATQNRPDMPQAWQLLGRWQYRVAHYSLFERLYSNLVLGGTPAGGSSREAIEALEKAHRIAPKNLQFCYDLARMYKYQGRRRRAIEILRHAEKISPVTSEDLVLSRLCRKMLPPLLRADARRQKRLASIRRPATHNAGAPVDTVDNNDGSD